MQPFLAMIMPVGSAGGGPADPGYSPPWAQVPPGFPPGYQPPYPSQGPGFPTHPIAQPPWGWGKPPGYNPRPDNTLPGNQPYPDQGLPGNQPYPDQGLPGQQPGIWGPNDPRPTHPIFIPPMGPPQPPLGTWGPNDPRPTPPIYIPIMPPPTEDNPHPEHPIYLPVYPSHPIYFPPGSSPAEIAAKLKALVEFATGNLPENPDETPTPV